MGLAAFALAALGAWDEHARAAYLTRYFALARLAEAPGPRPLIVAVGSSKTRCALEYDLDMETLLHDRGVEVKFVRMTRGLVTFGDLEPVFAALIQARPRLVLIESDLVLFQPNIYAPVDMVEPGWRKHLRNSAASIVLGDRAFGNNEPSERFENFSASRELGCGRGIEEGTNQHLQRLRQRRGSNVAERRPYLAAFRALREAGVQVELLDIPRAPNVEAQFPEALQAAGRHNREVVLRSALVRSFDPAPAELPPDMFLDAGHLTTAGRARFSGWFAARLQNELNDR